MHVVLSMEVGGAEKLVNDMVRSRAFEESRPVVCCLDAVGELGEKLRRDGYTIYLKGRKSGVDWSVIPWLREIILTEKIAVVHAHQYTPLFYTVPAALLAGRVKVVYTEHGRCHPDRRSWKRALINPFLALGVTHLVSISGSTVRAMATFDNLPLPRIKVIHNGVDFSGMNPPVDPIAKRRSLGMSDTCRVIGTAARLEEIKNIPMMLRGFKLVLQAVPDSCLLIAGQGSQMDKLKSLADELGIAEKIIFAGLRFDLPEIYQVLDVFLLTSFTEGISMTLLEAMASCLPAVVTDVGGNREVVIDGETGYLVPVDADAALADRVVELLNNPFLAQQSGLKAQERVHRLFSFEGMLDSYRAIYRD